MGLLEIHQLEEIMQTYVLLKENKASRCQINDSYYLLFKDNVIEAQRAPRIKKWVEDNYTEYYKMVVMMNNRDKRRR